MFEDVRHEQSLIKLLSLEEPGKLKQSKFTDYEINMKGYIALDKLLTQMKLKKYTALQLLE